MRCLLGVFGFSALAACYSPSFKDCELVCAGTKCPSGLSCDVSGVCRLPGATGTCGGSSMDAGPCWPFAPTNISPCAADFPASVGPLAVPADRTIDTSSPTIGEIYAGGRFVVLHVDSLRIVTGASVKVTGTRPLIIVSDGDVTIDGTLQVIPTIGPVQVSCVINDGSDGQANDATGGGGGGYGGAGAAGGIDSGSPGGIGPGGVASGSPMLEPLRPGCPGGRGGNSSMLMGGTGGLAGGALQISAKTTIVVNATGLVTAGGGGGGGGPSMICAGALCSAGGGGGGTGGSIFLEANAITVMPAGKVCAPGGAGGDAGTSGNPAGTGMPGGDGMACAGGPTGSSGVHGGKGADTTAPGAGSDGLTTATGQSGGGGGGGVGRIRIRGVSSVSLAGAQVMPVPTN